MRGVRNAKRVSWATDGNLCQVRLFLSEDSPSQVGISLQDHLQPKKKASVLHCTGSVPDDVLPPGFEGVNTENQLLKNKLAQIPLMKWRCPPRFMLNASWRVVAGDGSKEVENQNERELRELEAIYPRSSAIPPDPAISPNTENLIYDDTATPLVPIVPIEEEAIGDNTTDPFPTGASIASFLPGFAQPSYATSACVPNLPEIGGMTSLSSQPQLLAAASAALSALASSNQQGKIIDQELLMKILSNPTMLEDLVKNLGNSASSRPMQITPSVRSSSVVVTMQDQPPHLPARFSQIDTSISSTSNEQFLTPPPNGNPSPLPYPHAAPPSVTGVGLPPSSGTSISAAPPTKDINYYKSLIQQHGEDRQPEVGPVPLLVGHHNNSNNQHNPDTMEHSRNRESKPKFMKPCIYFHSTRGCRHGTNCAYQHDGSMIQQQKVNSGSVLEMQSAKRMKTDNREMRGPPQSYS